jgi:multidrug efflux system membrane fusion protein
LLKPGFASAQQVTDQASMVTQLEASVAGDKAAIFNAQTQLGYTTIASPIDGVTGIKHVDIGNIVQPGTTTPIVTITQIQGCRRRTFPTCRQRWPRALSTR